MSWTMPSQRCHRWSFTVRLILGAQRQYAGHACLSAANFGLRFLVPTWKKASSGSDLLLRQLCARLTRNIWRDYARPLSRLATIALRGVYRLRRSYDRPTTISFFPTAAAWRREPSEKERTHRGGRIVNGCSTTEAHTLEDVQVQTRTAEIEQTCQGIAVRNKG